MTKSLCRLLMSVNSALVAIFFLSLNAIRENKIPAKIPEFTALQYRYPPLFEYTPYSYFLSC